MQFLDGSWPWWWGALGLASVCLASPLLFGRPCAVSGFWAAVVNWREQRAAARAEAQLAANPEAAEQAMLEAALQELGDEIPPELRAELEQARDAPAPRGPAVPTREPPSLHLVFLGALAAGGALAALSRGELTVAFDMGRTYGELLGTGLQGLLVLFAGGLLVGFGVRLAGGCTMGHGLSGCSALQPGSIVATAAFFGAAVGVSLLLAVL